MSGTKNNRSRAAVIRVLAVLGVAMILTGASSVIQRTRLEVQDWDCPPAPTSCARPVLVAGFPFVYLSDYHGIPPVGSVSLGGGLLGEDLFQPGAFCGNVVMYFLLVGGTSIGISRLTWSSQA